LREEGVEGDKRERENEKKERKKETREKQATVIGRANLASSASHCCLCLIE